MSRPEQQRRIWWAVGSVLVLAFLAYGYTAFKSNLTPYVSFSEAMEKHSKVQVAGKLVCGSSAWHEDTSELVFAITDDSGARMPVRYRGVKPANFEEATQVVAIGSWNGKAFDADHLLVKCPSKYQGMDADVSKHQEEARGRPGESVPAG